MKSTTAPAATPGSNGAAKLLFIAGTTLLLGAGAAAFDAAVNGQQASFSFLESGQTQTRADVTPLISYMPPAYDTWRRTDFVEPKAARRALERYSAAFGLPSHGDAEADDKHATLAHYAGPNAEFVIFIKRIPAGEWAPPEGPVSIMDGKIFRNHAPGHPKVVDISLERPDGLSVTVRGRGQLATVWPVLRNLGFWRS
ncbi:hypothetical protein [Oceanibium sediminis]|uniref:hypothetical protein n=1 Tax=Oceanibium sediminis TaxID=2026339 RepID=UPI000DD40D5D|nr:hypothetical protein [Oceanibium sediminis]